MLGLLGLKYNKKGPTVYVHVEELEREPACTATKHETVENVRNEL